MFPRSPRGLRPTPWDIRTQCLTGRSPWPPGSKELVRRALRGSLLPVQAAGSRLRSQKRAASASAVREGESRFHPLHPLPQAQRPRAALAEPDPRAGRTTTRVFIRRNSALPRAAPGEPGIPSSPMGHPSSPPGSGGSACTRTTASVCISPSRA